MARRVRTKRRATYLEGVISGRRGANGYWVKGAHPAFRAGQRRTVRNAEILDFARSDKSSGFSWKGRHANTDRWHGIGSYPGLVKPSSSRRRAGSVNLKTPKVITPAKRRQMDSLLRMANHPRTGKNEARAAWLAYGRLSGMRPPGSKRVGTFQGRGSAGWSEAKHPRGFGGKFKKKLGSG